MVSREALCAAFQRGDVALISAYLAQDHAQEDPELGGIDDFMQLLTTGSMLEEAAVRGCVDVVEWFFALDHVKASCTALWTILIGVCYVTVTTQMSDSHAAILELLLESEYFINWWPSRSHRGLLDSLVPRARTPRAIEILTAHGAQLGLLFTADCVDISWRACQLVQACPPNSAPLIGAKASVSFLAADIQTAFDYSFDFTNLDRGDSFFIFAVRRFLCGIVHALLDKTFQDVDERDEKGRKALMLIVRGKVSHPYATSMLALARLLLSFNTNVNAIDNSGTPLPMHALRGPYPEMVQLLLEHGADPNIRARNGCTPADVLDLCDVEEPNVATKLSLLLEHGACRDASGVGGLSIVDRLRATTAGASFICVHPEYFKPMEAQRRAAK